MSSTYCFLPLRTVHSPRAGTWPVLVPSQPQNPGRSLAHSRTQGEAARGVNKLLLTSCPSPTHRYNQPLVLPQATLQLSWGEHFLPHGCLCCWVRVRTTPAPSQAGPDWPEPITACSWCSAEVDTGYNLVQSERGLRILFIGWGKRRFPSPLSSSEARGQVALGLT